MKGIIKSLNWFAWRKLSRSRPPQMAKYPFRLFEAVKTPIWENKKPGTCGTVDGRNPAPPGMYKTL